MTTDHGLQNEEQIYLDQILGLLRSTFGYDSWVANGFIKDIHCINNTDPLNNEIATLAISKEGVLYYNKTFWAENIDTPNKVVEAITHELLHKVFGDFGRDYKGFLSKTTAERRILRIFHEIQTAMYCAEGVE